MAANIVEEQTGYPIGKIIAVHLSYPSRAAQRGRTPAEASYFLKAPSSVSGSGQVFRPDNTELLVFEGEVALVIGTAARAVTEEEAWSHVGWVTAGNDMGLLDFRAADKGSNVRSKSGDGMTPLGPALIPAREVDPTRIGIRTTVDGVIAQEDSTSTLLFSFAHFIADLSRVMTLEPGDVILTGTPAGSSVLQPGQVVEVEVFSETNPALTSGVLRTEVVEAPALADIGSKPAASECQRVDAWGSREAAGLEPEPVLTEELRERLAKLAVATISSQLRKRGYNNVSMDGIHPLVPGTALVGTARTLRYVAHRPDLFAAKGGGFNAQKQIVDAVQPGEVVVMEARGVAHAGTLGDILALRARVRGAAGIITDGAVRDASEVAKVGLPVFSQSRHPAVLGRSHVPWETDVTITCGGATVQPGDVIVANDDGALAFPLALAEEIVEACEAQELKEQFVYEMVEKGESLDGLFPVGPQWAERFEEWAQGR